MLDFIYGELLESKAFRNEETMEKYSVEELSEIFFAMILSLQLLNLTKFQKNVEAYALDSVKYPLYERIYLTNTDMGNIIATLKNAKEILGERDVDLPMLELKRYLRDFKYDTMSSSLKRMLFLKLQSKLKIKNTVLTSLRRSIVDSENLSWGQKKRYGEQLYQFLRKYQYKSDILILLSKINGC